MPRIKKNVQRMIDLADSRFTRSRPGSVLILVVALLVLMALLGTAYLVTARNDRIGSRLYEHSVQIDMLLDGVLAVAETTVQDTTYQQAPTQQGITTTGVATGGNPLYPSPAGMAVWNPTITYTCPQGVYYVNNTGATVGGVYTPGLHQGTYWICVSQGPVSNIAPPVDYANNTLSNKTPNWMPYDPWQHYDDIYTTSNTLNYTATLAGISNNLSVDHTGLASRYPLANGDAVGNVQTAMPNYTVTAGQPSFSPTPFPKGTIVVNGGNYFLNTYQTPSPLSNDLNPFIPSTAILGPGWKNLGNANPLPITNQDPKYSTAQTIAVWPMVTSALIGTGSVPGVFEDPRNPYGFLAGTGNPYARPDGVRYMVQPTYCTIGNQNFPALQYYSTVNGRYEVALAASATGNGIADSFLWRLPCGTIDGITYFAAVKIIDNNSQINVNVANTSRTDFAGDGSDSIMANVSGTPTPVDLGMNPGLLPTSVGLAEMVNTSTFGSASAPLTDQKMGTEMMALNQYRVSNYPMWAANNNNYNRPSGIYIYKTIPSPTQPVDDLKNSRADFLYRNLGDALWCGLGRRLDNPGYCAPGATPTSFQALSWGDAAALAYRFDLVNPAASPCTTETLLYSSLVQPSGGSGNSPQPTTPWDPSNTATWYTNSFKESGLIINRRPFFTTRNPVNNSMPMHPLEPLQASLPTTIVSGATGPLVLQLMTGSNAPTSALPLAYAPGASKTYASLAVSPQYVIPRVSLNTSDVTAEDPPLTATAARANNMGLTFGTPVKGPSLWLGFYNAMADGLRNIGVANVAAYRQQDFNVTPSTGTGPLVPVANAPPVPLVPPQFRSPIRDLYAGQALQALGTTPSQFAFTSFGSTSNTTFMDPNQTMLLRSFIAAVNTKDIRDSDDNVTHVQASLQQTGGGLTPVMSAWLPTSSALSATAPYLPINETPMSIDAHVYGTEAQPFITEVYVNNETMVPGQIAGSSATVGRVNPNGNKSNPKGYVAIQLYNPYDHDIDMSNWTLGVLLRARAAITGPGTGTASVMMPISNFHGFGYHSSTGVCIIPHRSYMVLENYPSTTAANVAGMAFDAAYRPWAYYGNSATSIVPPTTIGNAAFLPDGGPPTTGASVIYPAGVVYQYVPCLHEVLNDPNITVNLTNTATPATNYSVNGTFPGGELFLLRQLPASHLSANVAVPIVNIATPASYTTSYTLSNAFHWNQLPYFAPVDSFDFTGMGFWKGGTPNSSTIFSAFHYVRKTPVTAGSYTARDTNWQFVYPGRWDPYLYANTFTARAVKSDGVTPASATSGFGFRQEGIVASQWFYNSPTNFDSWNYSKPGDANIATTISGGNIPLAYYYGAFTFGIGGNGAYCKAVPAGVNIYASLLVNSPLASYPNFFAPIMLNATDFGGPSKLTTVNSIASGTTNNMFPFGGFCRVGDVLQVPYIGSYTLLFPQGASPPDTPAQILEINPVTVDSALADDFDSPVLNSLAAQKADDAVEQVGRFCPLSACDPGIGALPSTIFTPASMVDTYAWASHVFDYFTAIQNPHDDYLPNIDPNVYSVSNTTGYGLYNPVTQAYMNGLGVYDQVPQTNLNNTTPNASNEDLAGVDGLININTAPWNVLQRVPWVPVGSQSSGGLLGPGTGSDLNNDGLNRAIARAIVAYREAYGPFKTLFDLNKVQIQPPGFSAPGYTCNSFQTVWGLIGAAPGVGPYPSYTGNSGNLAPYPHEGIANSPSNDFCLNDFRYRFNEIIRISNLVTTRSDTYTVYVLVQGWSGVGQTATPQLVVQRRTAEIIDRSANTSNPGKSAPAFNKIPIVTN